MPPTISFSAALFSFCLRSSPASGSFPISQLFTSGSNLCESLSIPCKIKTTIYVSHDFCWYSNDRKYARLRAKALWRMEFLINNLIRMFKKLDVRVLETVWNWTSDLSAYISSSCRNKMPWTEWFKQQKLSSHSSGGWTSKIKVPTRLVSPEASLLGLWMAAFWSSPHMAFPLCLCIPDIFLSSCKERVHSALEPHPYDIFAL